MNRVTMFQELDESQIRMLSPLFEPFSCQEGTIILRQGAPADSLYLLIAGTVEMFFKPYDGNPITVSHVEKGGLFGWSAVVGSEWYTSSAIAIEDVEAYRIRGSALRKFCRDHPEAGADILERLAESVSLRWKNAHEQIKALLFQGIKKSQKAN